MGSVPDATPTPRLLCGEAKSKLTSAKRRCRRPTAPSTGSVLHKHLKSVSCANAFVNYGPKLLPSSAPKILQTKTSKNRRLNVTGSGFETLNLRIGTPAVQVRSGQARAPMASPFDGAGARRDNKFPNCYPHAAKINNGQRSTLYAPLGSLLQTQGKNCEIPPYLHQRLQKSKNSGGLEHHKSRLIVAITNDFCPLSTPAKF